GDRRRRAQPRDHGALARDHGPSDPEPGGVAQHAGPAATFPPGPPPDSRRDPRARRARRAAGDARSHGFGRKPRAGAGHGPREEEAVLTRTDQMPILTAQ